MNTIPEELRNRRQWVNWKKIVRDGKPTKIPVQPNGKPASSTDPATWHGFSELSGGFSGFGFVFADSDPYIGIDLDGCRDPKTGKMEEWAREIVLKFSTYAEISPSETGVKLFAVHDSLWSHSNKIDLPGDGYGGKRPGIEVYDAGRYFAVTGQRLKDMHDLAECDDQLAWLAETYNMTKAQTSVQGYDVAPETPLMERAARYVEKMEPSVSGQSGHNSAFKAACALVQGFGLSSSEAFTLMCEFNRRCEPPWSDRELRHKIDSASKQPGQIGYLRDAKPDDWSKIYIRGNCPAPDPEPTETDNIRHTTLRDAANLYLKQLAEGKEYLIETGIPELDYACGGGLAPGEMVIVGGRPSHGKSAIALQMAHHMTSCGILAIIVSEEMSALAIGKRTIQFASDVPEEHWKTRDSEVAEQIKEHFASRKEAIIVESCGTIERLIAEIEKLVEETGAGVVMVDYVQLLAAKGNGRYEQVTHSSQEMRRLASRLGILVIVLAQLNRNIEERKQFTPMASDLKETGQLEQDADVIIFGVWPHRIDSSNPPNEYSFFVVKNRNRAINSPSFKVRFEPSRQRLIEEAVKYQENYEPRFEAYNKGTD